MATHSLEDRALNLLRFLGAEPARPGAKYVLVIGSTGSGKSTFISNCMNRDVGIGYELNSYTHDMGVFRLFDKEHNQEVYLIDTPGFDDTHRSDMDTLQIIAYYLGVSYANGNRIEAIIYMHRISDTRFTGSSRYIVDLITGIIGPEAVPNLLIVTSMWSRNDLIQQLLAERQLKKEEKLLGGILRNGARMERHVEDGETVDLDTVTAKSILDNLLTHCQRLDKGLLIQREMINQESSLSSTTAGQHIFDRRNKQQHESLYLQARFVEAQLVTAVQKQDRDLVMSLQRQKADLLSRLDKAKHDSENANKQMVELHEEESSQILTALDEMDAKYTQDLHEKQKQIVELHKKIENAKSTLEDQGSSREDGQDDESVDKEPGENRYARYEQGDSGQRQEEMMQSMIEKLSQLENKMEQSQTELLASMAKQKDALAAKQRMRTKILECIGDAAIKAIFTGAVGAVTAVACTVM